MPQLADPKTRTVSAHTLAWCTAPYMYAALCDCTIMPTNHDIDQRNAKDNY